MDNPTNWDNSSPEDLSKSWEENCQDQLRNIHELNQFGLQLLTDWQRRRDVAILQLRVHVVHGIWMMGIYCSPRYVDRVLVESSGERENVRQELLSELRCSKKCRDIIRMGPYAFAKLCEILRGTGRLKDTRNASVEEQVAKFLYILAHNERIRTVSFFFRRSNETISRHFHNVLRAVIYLEDQFLLQPNGAEVPQQIRNSHRFYPYFKDCVGAIDGTHIHVKVSATDAPRYRGRKEYTTQNVLAACDFDMRFTYVLPGWEGIASDSRIIKNALSREDKLIIPRGKYYLVDAGFMLRSGLLAPYRGVRYHLKEYSARGPENAEEIFNHRHSSLRNVIERTFGVLKKRFPIIAGMTEPFFPVDIVTKIILACCILHNYLMGVDPDERLIAEVDQEISNGDTHNEAINSTYDSDADAKRGAILRTSIATRMWNDYVSHDQ